MKLKTKTFLSSPATTELEQTLAELDRLLHRSQTLLRITHRHTGQPPASWKAVQGLWKGIFKGDPVQYQRQLRDEE